MYAFVCVSASFLYFATLINERKMHENRIRGLNASFFSHVRGTGTIYHFLLWWKKNFFVEVLKICSFRKCNSHKFDRGLLFGTMVWPQNSYSIKVHIFDCFSSVHHLLWILNRKVHRERKVTLSCNWNISSHKDIFRII